MRMVEILIASSSALTKLMVSDKTMLRVVDVDYTKIYTFPANVMSLLTRLSI